MKKGIAIFYLSVGSGHQIAAEAIANQIRITSPKIPLLLSDPFSNKIEILPTVFSALQAVSVILAPDIYDLAWRRKASYDSYQWLEDTKLLQEHLASYLSGKSIETVIATHVLPSILGVGLKKKGVISHLYNVVTDFGLHSLWPISEIDKYFVATEELKNILVYRGIDEAAVEVTGIPINHINLDRNFIKPIGKKVKILIIAGGIRSGGYAHLQFYIREIIKGLEINKGKVELTIVTGNQKELRKKLAEIANGSSLSTRILGYVHNLPMLMSMNDILVTKPGGLIISEALAVGISLVLLKPGPGQENANSEFLIRKGIALNGENPDQALKSINYLVNDINTLYTIKLNTKKLGSPDSAKKIIDSIRVLRGRSYS